MGFAASLLPSAGARAAAAAVTASASEKLPELALFKRCFTHLTGRIPSRSAPLTEKVRTGQLSAVDACLAVLNSVTLDSSSGDATASMTVLTSGDDPSTLKYQVLRKFNDFHRTWFSSDYFFNSGATLHDNQIYDEAGPALYITRALLGPDNYSSVVTHAGELEAVRTAGSQNLNSYSYLGAAVGNFHNYTSTGANGSKIQAGATPLGSQSGDLTGIRAMPVDKIALSVAMRSAPTSPKPVHNHQGGGLIGSIPYLLLNHGQSKETKSDGGIYVARRHARNIFKELLCRDIPPLRELDAISFVTPTASQTASTPAFRTAATCMACHAALDNFAGTTRAIYLSETPYYTTGGRTYVPSINLQVQSTTKAAETTAPDSDSDFGARPTTGRLLYRSYDGTLIDSTVANLTEMGNALANSNDLYVCAAKKYFEYFTGLSVSLQDTGNPTSSILSQADQYYRDEVIKLGLSLKAHGSLKTLVQEILSLDLYQSRSQRSSFATSSETSSARVSSTNTRRSHP
jgi:hypothetical protein